MDQRQRTQTVWWSSAVAVLLVVAGGAVAIGAGIQDERPDGADDLARIGPLAPHDGLDSLRLPVAVDPAEDLVDGQVVTVSGEGFPTDRQLGVVMCSGAVDLGGGVAQCQISPSTPVTSDAEGRFSVEHPVRRVLHIGGHEIDCADPPPPGVVATCAVAVGAVDDYDQSGVAPVVFDPGIAPPPQPSVEVSGTDHLLDGDEVTITIVDGSVEDLRELLVCTTDPGMMAQGYPEPGEVCTSPWDLDPAVFEASTAEAPTGVTFVARRWFDPSAPDPIDCGEAPGRCWLQVAVGHGLAARVPLSFDPSVDPPALDAVPPTPEVGSEWERPQPTFVGPDDPPTDTVGPARALPPPETTMPAHTTSVTD